MQDNNSKSNFFGIFGTAILVFLALSFNLVQEAVSQEASAELSIKPKDLAQMSQTVRNLIEQNQELFLDNQELVEELGKLKEEQSAIEGRLRKESEEKESLEKRLQQVEGEKNKSNQKIKTLEENLKSLQEIKEGYDQKIKQFEEKLAKKQELEAPSAQAEPAAAAASKSNEIIPPPAPPEAAPVNYESLDLLAKIEISAQKETQFKKDTAKIHYNSGNDYVKKGNYAAAVKEYQEALYFDSSDPDTHYNLAFLYDQYIKDYKMAVSYYQKYLEFRPQAADRGAIQKRIEELRTLKK